MDHVTVVFEVDYNNSSFVSDDHEGQINMEGYLKKDKMIEKIFYNHKEVSNSCPSKAPLDLLISRTPLIDQTSLFTSDNFVSFMNRSYLVTTGTSLTLVSSDVKFN